MIATEGRGRWSWWFSGLALLVAGCVVTVEPDPNDNGNGDGNGGGGDGETIRVRIVNTTNVDLDPEVYLSAQAVGVEELFQPGNKYTAFGVATLGIIEAFGSDSFTVTCADARILGTTGGRFGDNLNEPDGFGRQIVLTQDLNVFCGGTVTFTYSRSGDAFTTTFDVDP